MLSIYFYRCLILFFHDSTYFQAEKLQNIMEVMCFTFIS